MLHREHRRLRTTRDTNLLVDALDVIPRGLRRDAEECRDRACCYATRRKHEIEAAVRDETLQLAGAQCVVTGEALLAREA